MTLLAVETSCDETSAAVVRDGRALSNVVSSQIKLHAEYGGVVPELATREHLRHWMPVTQAALRAANVQPTDLDAIADYIALENRVAAHTPPMPLPASRGTAIARFLLTGGPAILRGLQWSTGYAS